MPLSFPSNPTVLQTSVQNGRTYQWSGYAWELLTSTGAYTLPTATASLLGGVKVGSGLTITDGVLAATGGGGSLSGSVTIPASGDQFWTQTQLLLKGDGDLTDSSSYARSVTAYGNAAATGTAKYGSNSLAFDGTGDYLRVAGSAGFSFPGDFTLETWVFFNAASASFDGAYGACLMATYPAGQGGNQGWQLRINGTSSGYNTINVYTGTTDLNWTATFNLNQWHHVAVTRSGSSIRAFVDGVQVGSTVTNSDDMTPGATTDLWIGQLNAHPYLFSLNGRLDDLRVTKGTARYTANFTPPAVAAGTGTYAAAQTYPVTITGSGGGGGSGLAWSSVPASATASGTAGSIAYDGSYFYVAVGSNQWERAALSTWATDPSFSNVSLLLHMDGLGSAFVDSSGTPKTITTSGNATQSAAQSVFGRSAYFDGSGDSIQTPTVGQSSLHFSNQLHTVEFWFRTNSTTQYACLFYRGREGVEGAYDYVININNVSSSSGDIYLFSLGLGGSALGSSINGLNDNNWHHLAVCRDSGNVIRMYIDGVQRASMTYDMTQSYSANSDSIIRIGRDGVLTGRDFIGNIDELRITTGVCRYPSGTTFTPPTAAFPDA